VAKKSSRFKHIKAHLILFSLSDKQLTPQATLDMVNSIKAQSDIESHYQLSVIINDLPDQPDGLAIDLMKKAAEGSHVGAQLTLAKHYHRLNKYSKYSDQEFRYLTQKWFEKAADAGNAEAQYNLGYLYLYHQYENFGSKDAYALFEKSANQGNAEAQYQLGSRYFFSGPEQNESQAMLWYQKAAEGGHPEAQMKLGSTYYYGSSVIKKDKEFGLKWIELAAEQGEPEAKDLLERIQK